MTKLNDEQMAGLARVVEADDRWRQAKLNLKIEAKKYVEDRLAKLAMERDSAVWDCVEAGIPKRQIGLEGLKTSSPNAVYEIIDRVSGNEEKWN